MRPYDCLSIDLPGDRASGEHSAVRLEAHAIKFDVFHLRSRLARVQDLVLRKWLFPPPRKTYSLETAAWRVRLLAELMSWREHSLFTADPRMLMKDLHRSDGVHVRVLEASYFNTLVALCSDHEDSLKSPNERGLYKVSRKQIAYCLKDAVRLLQMLAFFPDGNHAALW